MGETTSSRPRSGSKVPDEAALLAELRAGSDAAYETLVRTYGGRMLATARRMLGNEADARDAVQDAFLSAFRGLATFREQGGVGTWLHRIVINAALMRLRSRGRKREEPLDELLPRFRDDGHRDVPDDDWTASGEDELERQEVRRIVRRCIDALPEGPRTVLLLRDIEQWSTAETAEALGVSENAVKLRLHRARQALRTLLAPHFSRAAS